MVFFFLVKITKWKFDFIIFEQIWGWGESEFITLKYAFWRDIDYYKLVYF